MSHRATLCPVPLPQVTIADGFWSARLAVNRRVGLEHQYRMCKETGRIDAFALKWRPGQPNPPHEFWDSDVAKWIEAACYSLTTHPDAELAGRVEGVVDLVVSAQRADGYLNTHFQLVRPGKHWTNLRDWHELYCAGHLMEAAVAHHRATGSRRLLDCLCRYADHIDSVFGPGPGKKKGYCGHPEVELALAKLYRATGNARYLRLAKYFVDQRGARPHYFDQEALARGEDPASYWAKSYSYCQAHVPLRQQAQAVGHAVRAAYLYSGMADVAALTGDEELLAACRRMWDSLILRKMYLTGGIGSRHAGESLGEDYELPNATAYAETCAAIALVFFAHRMLHIDPNGRYADVMEQALYNGVLSGVSLDGRKFFYVNPLASAGGHHRQEWFGCACCPPNLARLLASLGQYVYSSGPDSVWVHLYIAGTARIEASSTRPAVRLMQETDYPWAGRVRLTLNLAVPAQFDLMLRVPGWCDAHHIRVNGRPLAARQARGYAKLRRAWRDGDVVELDLAMPVQRVTAHPLVAENVGKVALRRGPLVYCLEQCDNAVGVRGICLPESARLRHRFDKRLLGGVVVVEGEGIAAVQAGWKGRLYRPAGQDRPKKACFLAIPYCLWDNRRAGPMTVWLPRC